MMAAWVYCSPPHFAGCPRATSGSSRSFPAHREQRRSRQENLQGPRGSHSAGRCGAVGRGHEGRACQLGPVEIRGKRHNQNRLKQPGQRVALPHDDGTSTSLLTRAVSPKIGPPDLATLHPRSSRSSAAAHSSSPASARARSSSAWEASRVKSQRLESGRRTTMTATRSPARSGSGDTGRRRPFS